MKARLAALLVVLACALAAAGFLARTAKSQPAAGAPSPAVTVEAGRADWGWWDFTKTPLGGS
jgi:hypothetical protein